MKAITMPSQCQIPLILKIDITRIHLNMTFRPFLGSKKQDSMKFWYHIYVCTARLIIRNTCPRYQNTGMLSIFWQRATTVIADWFAGRTGKTVSFIPNRLNFCVIWITYVCNWQIWPRTAYNTTWRVSCGPLTVVWSPPPYAVYSSNLTLDWSIKRQSSSCMSINC